MSYPTLGEPIPVPPEALHPKFPTEGAKYFTGTTDTEWGAYWMSLTWAEKQSINRKAAHEQITKRECARDYGALENP